MSSGQRPRWPAYFPRMKRRGQNRTRRVPRIVLYGADWTPVWPPVIAGRDIRSGTVEFTTAGRTRRLSGTFWHDVQAADDIRSTLEDEQ